MISVEIRTRDRTLLPHWAALARRANANVFMHPAALLAAAVTGFATVHMLLAWDADVLVGLWALRERRVAPFLPKFLAAPPYEFAFVSSPVVDPDHRNAVIPALFDAIANTGALPKVLQLKLLDGSSPTFGPMMVTLGARHAQILTLSERARPFLSAEGERKRSGSPGNKLRQDWNRLSALGAVDIVNDRTPEDARETFEIFLELEARSWKGANGTALLSRARDATFTRQLIAHLADVGSASVALLRVDGKPIAAQVLFYSGSMAYTWKTAFDADFAKYSPGALLIDKVTDTLFAGGIQQIESCSADGSFMEQLWTGRRMTVDMLVGLDAHKSASFALAAATERGHVWLREQRHRLRGIAWASLSKRKNLAVTRS